MSARGTVLIWWLSQVDQRCIGDHLDDSFPDYIREEYVGMLGRPKRGRLWVDDRFGEVEVGSDLGWSSPMGSYLKEHCGGVVVWAADVHHLSGVPGIVTWPDLTRWGTESGVTSTDYVLSEEQVRALVTGEATGDPVVLAWRRGVGRGSGVEVETEVSGVFLWLESAASVVPVIPGGTDGCLRAARLIRIALGQRDEARDALLTLRWRVLKDLVWGEDQPYRSLVDAALAKADAVLGLDGSRRGSTTRRERAR